MKYTLGVLHLFGVQKKEQVEFMKRILLMVLKLLGHVPAWFWRICSFAKDTEEQRYSIEEKYNYIREIAIKANKAGRVTLSAAERRICRKKTVIFSIRIIRECLMCWLFLKR